MIQKADTRSGSLDPLHVFSRGAGNMIVELRSIMSYSTGTGTGNIVESRGITPVLNLPTVNIRNKSLAELWLLTIGTQTLPWSGAQT